jgi:dihydroorotate dehydrogenase (NAD+) catalytic subunit
MIEITAAGKNSLVVETPVLFASGMVGYDAAPYRKLLSLDKFGGLVTHPVTLAPRYPANGARVVPLSAGFLLHTGIPNPGVQRVIRDYEDSWRRSVLRIILHVAASTTSEMEQIARAADQCEHIDGLEIGLPDEITLREMRDLLAAARYSTDLPLLVRLPLYSALVLGEVAQHHGAGALVVAAPPRGTERDPQAGRLIGGRLYGRWLKPQVLRVLGRVVQYAEVPVIACGGIHNPDDARDYITAGARAVQLDSIVWINPKMAEVIASNLGGLELTRTSGALADEWEPGMGLTQRMKRQGQPSELPELSEDEATRDTPDQHIDWDGD